MKIHSTKDGKAKRIASGASAVISTTKGLGVGTRMVLINGKDG